MDCINIKIKINLNQYNNFVSIASKQIFSSSLEVSFANSGTGLLRSQDTTLPEYLNVHLKKFAFDDEIDHILLFVKFLTN